jgi:S-adenosylhomocysteine hydrolase
MKTKDIIIRQFRIDDYDNVISLWVEAGIHYKPNGRENRQRMEKELKTGQALFLVAGGRQKNCGSGSGNPRRP